ncbi:L-aspartate oxidase [Bacillus luteolus]|uniref:L-aspartate oxidase n=1 Tax=Litchfieldia luteola TaxID=682179 RepID=A0ABR9QI05_9BACI|nr:L-aspartate oxidase [Cytobacillus luteolus]MBE4908126.1 L-aspartate oxidase [Cytobacillus luteolus]MBP1942911.1 L-aspartate oxidase [Cytobacillus luteolus]
MPFEYTDVLIVGSGIAALNLATKLSEHMNVRIITKSKIENSNSMLAQGGVAAAISPSDHWENHFQDTMSAGCYHNNKAAVKTLVELGPSCIRELMNDGMTFDCDSDGNLVLGLEGAHLQNRILHAGGDSTGKALMNYLFSKLDQKVIVNENEMILDLIIHDEKCVGVTSLNNHNEITSFYANHVVLATGGCGGLYSVTSNDITITGDGIAAAYRAGAEITDMEFIQFHPTMLFKDGKSHGLISEAVRGEGALLVNDKGKYIMEGVHDLKDLAPRDIVSRRIHKEYINGNLVFLDISMIKNFRIKFPTITGICEKAGISLQEGLLPVAPGAHFLMGGIKTNLYGESTINGLYAIGEAACTGVHGANRLASNSLLEGIVFASLLAKRLISAPKQRRRPFLFAKRQRSSSGTSSLPTANEIRNLMSRYAGIERDEKGLIYAKQWIESYLNKDMVNGVLLVNASRSAYTVINMLTTSWLILSSALEREESRGGHYRIDYPVSDSRWLKRYLSRTIKKDGIGFQELVKGAN